MKLIRRLGFGELRMHLLHSECNGTTQGALSIRVQGLLVPNNVIRAVEQIKQRYAMLDVVIHEQDGEYYFAHPDHTNAQHVAIRIPQPDSTTWLDVLQNENTDLLDSSQQLWRLAVVPYQDCDNVFDLILIMHHAVMDAKGSDKLIHEILTLISGGALEDFAQATPISVNPAAESTCLSRCKWEEYAKSQQICTEKIGDLMLFPHRASAPLEHRRTIVQTLKLTADELTTITAFCETHGISINAYISAILMTAVHNSDSVRNHYALFTAISLREMCEGILDDDFGCYLSVVPIFLQLPSPDGTLEALAKSYQSGLYASFLSFGRWIPSDYPTQTVQSAMKKLKAINTFVNDIGFTYSESSLLTHYGDFQLKHSYVIAERSLGNLAVILHGLKLGEEIFFTLSHTEPLQDRAWANTVMKNFADSISTPNQGLQQTHQQPTFAQGCYL